MKVPSERFNKECKQRELRRICHQNFLCGENRAYAINQSTGGMCFRIDCRIEPGQVVTLSHGPALCIKARIAWTRRLVDCTEVGVQYLDIQERVEAWLAFLAAGQVSAQSASGGEPILALPAPGQTFRPTYTGARIQLQNTVVTSAAPTGIGKSWRAARHLMGPGNANGNSAT